MRYSWTGRDLNAEPDDVIDDDVETITQKDIETRVKAQADIEVKAQIALEVATLALKWSEMSDKNVYMRIVFFSNFGKVVIGYRIIQKLW